VELINEEAAMFDSLLMDSYVSSTTGVRLMCLRQVCNITASIKQKLDGLCHLVASPIILSFFFYGPFCRQSA
jgi:hypothetical protein